MAYTKYSLTPANNTATPPDGAPEGMLPSAVNDTMRDMMAQIRDCGDGIRDGTYTMTAPKITGGTITGATLTGNTFTSPVISGGSINNTPIGATTASTGAFSTLSATGATTFSGATVVSGSLTANTFSSSGATITGGSVSGITDLAIADGGTGASTAAAARTNLGLDGFVNMKNRIINGAMVIDQRNAGASVTATTSNLYTLDRWQSVASASSKFTVQQNAGSVTPPAGFTNYLGCTSSAATSLGATDNYQIVQTIEGFNSGDLAWGTANAKTVTLSFWVYSSLTGTFGGAITNYSLNRGYPFTFSISSANTWEYKTVTITGDTSGSWNNGTNSGGICLRFSLGTGSTYSGTAGAWAGSQLFSATGATSVVGTNGATFYITGVQLEVGSTATSFDYRPYGTELQLCQRYYQKTYDVGTVPGTTYNFEYAPPATAIGTGNFGMPCGRSFVVSMRATPTITTYDGDGNAGKISQWSVGNNQSYGSVGATQNQITAFDFGNNTTFGRQFPFAFVASSEL